MTAETIDAVEWLRKQVESAPDPVKELLTEMLGLLVEAEADALCGASCGSRRTSRVNSRDGRRERQWHSRAGNDDALDPEAAAGRLLPVRWRRSRRPSCCGLPGSLRSSRRPSSRHPTDNLDSRPAHRLGTEQVAGVRTKQR